jgi:hypothetical protein
MGWKINGLENLPGRNGNKKRALCVIWPHQHRYWEVIIGVLALLSYPDVRNSFNILVTPEVFNWWPNLMILKLLRAQPATPIEKKNGGLVKQIVKKALISPENSFSYAIAPAGMLGDQYLQWRTGWSAIASGAQLPVAHCLFEFDKQILTIHPAEIGKEVVIRTRALKMMTKIEKHNLISPSLMILYSVCIVNCTICMLIFW